MSTQSENAEIAVLQTQMADNKAQLNRVEGKVDALVTSVNNLALVQTDINEIRREINELKSHRFQTNWLYPTLAAAAGAGIALLVKIALNK